MPTKTLYICQSDRAAVQRLKEAGINISELVREAIFTRIDQLELEDRERQAREYLGQANLTFRERQTLIRRLQALVDAANT